MGSQLITSDEPTDDDWLNSKSIPYIIAANVIKDGRKMEICNMNMLTFSSSRTTVAKLIAKNAATRKAASPTIRFTLGDFANPVGTEPFVLFALTEESAKILAKCNMSLKFKDVHLIFRGLEQYL